MFAPCILIRGWGNLTGTGAHNLKEEEAANIQDTFAEYIVEQLNRRNPVLAVAGSDLKPNSSGGIQPNV